MASRLLGPTIEHHSVLYSSLDTSRAMRFRESLTSDLSPLGFNRRRMVYSNHLLLYVRQRQGTLWHPRVSRYSRPLAKVLISFGMHLSALNILDSIDTDLHADESDHLTTLNAPLLPNENALGV